MTEGGSETDLLVMVALLRNQRARTQTAILGELGFAHRSSGQLHSAQALRRPCFPLSLDAKRKIGSPDCPGRIEGLSLKTVVHNIAHTGVAD